MADNQLIERKLNTPGPKELLFRYIPYLPLIILCVTIAWALAWLKLRYATPIYNVTGKLLVKDQNPYGNTGEKFSTILELPQDNTNLNNEIEIIKSRTLASRVVRSRKFQTKFAIKGKIRTSEATSDELPFNWEIENILDSTISYKYTVLIINADQFKLNQEETIYNFGQLIKREKISFRLIPKKTSGWITDDNQYNLGWIPVDNLAASLSEALNVVQIEGANVLKVSYNTPNIKNGLAIVNAYMREYQLSSLEDKQQIAHNTLIFIDEQLDTLKRELGGVEKNLQQFREENKVFNTELQASQSLANYSESQKILVEQGVKIKVIDYLTQYISDPKNADKLVPSNLGIDEPSMMPQIVAFNELQLKKETSLKTTTNKNPLINDLNTAIEKIRKDILQNLKNVRKAYSLANAEFDNQSKVASQNLRSIPSKEKQLLEVTRRQAILQELYSFLLQKKLETAISSASTVSDIKILEPAISGDYPIKPNRRGIYTIAIFFGLALPGVMIFMREFLNDKVNSRLDIEEITEAPILGEVGHADDATTLAVKENNRSYIAEQFRIIRSNLRYIIPKNEKPIILVTSTFSGEGKSFISTNLGAVLALSGKKTVILEMDIRKPKILKGLGMNQRKGISNFVVSDIRVDEIIYPVPEVTDLFVIPCGPVPPNPGEILLDDRIGTLFSDLKRKFDAIIIDSAPVGLVSDGVSLAEHANATVYIVRHNYTLKKQIQMVDEIFENKKLPHLSIVINDIQISGGYGGYYGYGYGYGFGKKEDANQYFHAANYGVDSYFKRLLKFFKLR